MKKTNLFSTMFLLIFSGISPLFAFYAPDDIFITMKKECSQIKVEMVPCLEEKWENTFIKLIAEEYIDSLAATKLNDDNLETIKRKFRDFLMDNSLTPLSGTDKDSFVKNPFLPQFIEKRVIVIINNPNSRAQKLLRFGYKEAAAICINVPNIWDINKCMDQVFETSGSFVVQDIKDFYHTL